MVTVQGYQRGILETVVSHFDKHVLVMGPVFLDNNARPHRTCTVMDFLQRNAITTIPRPTRSPDLNLTENLWDILCGRVCQRHHAVQNSAEFVSTTASVTASVAASGAGHEETY